MQITKKIEEFKLNPEFLKLGILIMAVINIFILAGRYESYFYWVFDISAFLHYHTLLEFITIIAYFIIFVVTYYTYTKIHRTRLLIFSVTFFIIGWLDFFHTMSYSGMQGFFVEASIPRATTYWILARLIQSIGMMVAAFMPRDHKTEHQPFKFLVFAGVATCGIFYLVGFKLNSFPPLFIQGQGLTALKVYLEYLIMFFFLVTGWIALKDYKRTENRFFMLYITGITFAIFTEASFTLYRSVYDTYNFLGHIYKIVSAYYIFRGIFLFNLESHFKQLDQARETIKSYADNLEITVGERTKELQVKNEKMLLDLEYAKSIQQTLLPPEFLNINNVKFASQNFPCDKVSGDFYYIQKIDNENIGLAIADVAGHGVSAAMMTVFTERIIKPVYYSGKTGEYISPDRTLAYLYNEFNKANFPDEMHIVIFSALYNCSSRVLTYCSGGMNTIPILFRKSGEIQVLDQSQGFPICKFGDYFTPHFEKAEVHLAEGDRIIFFTDGLMESFKKQSTISKRDLIGIMQTNGMSNELREVKKKIDDAVKSITGKSKLDDDITYFIMEV